MTADIERIGCFGDARIMTVHGGTIDLAQPSPEDIDIMSIASGLACQARFSGQTRDFYSVAEHSVACAKDAQLYGRDIKTVFAVLMHDAAEAYLGDVTRPLKYIMGGRYKQLESMMQAAINHKLGVSFDEEIERAIKFHDEAICEREMLCFYPRKYMEVSGSFRDYLGDHSADWYTPKCLPPQQAKENFCFSYVYHQSKFGE